MRTVPIDSQEQILKEMEEGILLNSMQVVSATMEAAHIDPNEKEPPKEWVAAWGLEAARKRLRVAQQAWLPTREAPMFLKSAQNVAVGIIRSRAKEQSGPPELNVKKVALTISPKNYPEEMVVSDE
jgi:hypothetical protein